MRCIWLLLLAAVSFAQPGVVYVANLDAESCTLAWGPLNGKSINTIGWTAPGGGKAVLEFGNQKVESSRSWFKFDNLKPDTEYPFRVTLNGTEIGIGSIRTWPKKSKDLTFFVIGDWGDGGAPQYAVAAAMERELIRLEKTDSPVRFVLSTGDNIYKGGSRDGDWLRRFFIPYAKILHAVPFYAVLGNHDGNESEAAADLPAYLDNFFSPTGAMTRWYHFSYAGFADFLALDSTTNQYPGRPAPAYLEDGEQSKWLKDEMKHVDLPWRFAWFHHPIFTAGPNHPPAYPKLKHWFELFRDNGFTAVFSGHEHNLQFSERNPATGDVLYALSGAGGELRPGNVRQKMKARNISAWAPQTHFLIVHLEENVMTITPIGGQPIRMTDPTGRPVPAPLIIPRRVKPN